MSENSQNVRGAAIQKILRDNWEAENRALQTQARKDSVADVVETLEQLRDQGYPIAWDVTGAQFGAHPNETSQTITLRFLDPSHMPVGQWHVQYAGEIDLVISQIQDGKRAEVGDINLQPVVRAFDRDHPAWFRWTRNSTGEKMFAQKGFAFLGIQNEDARQYNRDQLHGTEYNLANEDSRTQFFTDLETSFESAGDPRKGLFTKIDERQIEKLKAHEEARKKAGISLRGYDPRKSPLLPDSQPV